MARNTDTGCLSYGAIFSVQNKVEVCLIKMKLPLPNSKNRKSNVNQQCKPSKHEKDQRVGDGIAVHFDKSPWEKMPKLNISFQLQSWWILLGLKLLLTNQAFLQCQYHPLALWGLALVCIHYQNILLLCYQCPYVCSHCPCVLGIQCRTHRQKSLSSKTAYFSRGKENKQVNF